MDFEFDQALDEVRHVPIVQVLSDHVELKAVGRKYKARCPFHAEKTPSFTVDPEKGFYHCFGCGAGGDAIRFVMQMESYDFMTAVRVLAGRFGIPLPEKRKRRPGQKSVRFKVYSGRQRIYDAVAALAQAHAESLPGSPGEKYLLEERGLSKRAMAESGVGWCPSVESALDAVGGDIDLLRRAGLASDRSDYYLSSRVIFPIHDAHGRVIQLAGRSLDPDSPRKYMNGGDSPIFNKSETLFGHYWASSGAKKAGSVIVTEGYLDVIAMRAAGFENAVAPMGTALTPEHAALLSRLSRRVVLLHDGDDAGAKASAKSLRHFFAAGAEVLVARLPDKEDPHSFLVKHGGGELKQLLDTAAEATTFFIDHLKARVGVGPKASADAVRACVSVFSELEDQVLASAAVSEAAKAFGVDPSMAARELASPPEPKSSPSLLDAREAIGIWALMQTPSCRGRVREVLESMNAWRPGGLHGAGAIRAILKHESEVVGPGELMAVLRRGDDRKVVAHAARLVEEYGEVDCDCAIDGLIDLAIVRVSKSIQRQIIAKEKAGESEAIMELAAEKQAAFALAGGRWREVHAA